MALGSAQKVIEDVGSEELRLTRRELNAALQFIDDIVQAATTAIDGDAFRVAVASLDPSALKPIVAALERPAAPQFPTV